MASNIGQLADRWREEMNANHKRFTDNVGQETKEARHRCFGEIRKSKNRVRPRGKGWGFVLNQVGMI